MKTSIDIDNIIGASVMQGAPGQEVADTVFDVTWDHNNRAIIEFESGHETTMSETELDLLLDEGEVQYRVHNNCWGSMYLV